MAIPAEEATAVLRYNDADQYVRVVLALAASYENGDYATTVPTAAPAPARTPPGAPVQTPAAEATAPSSPATTAPPTVNPTATPTENPSAEPTSTASATPAPTEAPETGPTQSDQPSQAPLPSATPPFHPGQIVDIGWAPAMRQVVLMLLTAPKTPAEPVGPADPESRPAQDSPQPAPMTTAPNRS
jgi:hypothetical protein